MSEVVLDAPDWPTILGEAKAGILSKAEICREYGVSLDELNLRMRASSVGYGALKQRIDRELPARVALVLSDEEIIDSAVNRGMAIVKSHLTLTRSLQVRLSMLLDGYDTLNDTISSVDDTGQRNIDPKKWLQSAALLDGISKIAERLTKMELATFGLNGIMGQTTLSPAALALSGPETEMEKAGDDPLEASLVYQQIVKGG